ncbi:MAG: non-ribosomal peptide synthetase, partial [Chloroflexi bacterium]
MISKNERIARLSPEKQALLAKKLAQKGAAGAATGGSDNRISIPTRADRALAPLSYTQHQFWLIDQMDPGSPHYILPAALQFTGPLQITALERSLAEIVRRHDILRARFVLQDQLPVQHIDPYQGFSLNVQDLSELAEAERSARVSEYLRQNAATTFDLSTGSLFKARLLKLGPDEHILLVCIHHIVADGWSTGVLVREIRTLYNHFTAQAASNLAGPGLTDSPLPALPIQFTDYATWQQDWLQTASFKAQLAYWQKQLADASLVLELPTDFSRPAALSRRGAHLPVRLPDHLTRSLREFARKEGATLYMTLLAVFQTLLFRYTGQADFSVGTPFANRRLPELEGLIGPLINTLVLRADFAAGAAGTPAGLTFRQVLARTRQTCLAAFSNAEVPFEMLVDALQVERSLSYTPVFQVMFALQDAPLNALRLDGLDLQMIDVENGLAKFDLVFVVTDDGQGLGGYLEYAADLYEPATIRRMFAHFLVLLESALANPDLPVAHLPLLTPAEWETILREWNATTMPFYQGCVHQLFEQWVERQPDDPALVYAGRQLTYRQLNRRANGLARHLRSLGIGPDTLAGILCQRGFDMVTAILAVLKAGGAYLPLDPAYPEDR